MGIRLSIEITTPIDDDDKQMMAGVAAMTFAIANSEQMQEQAEAEQEETGEPEPCGSGSAPRTASASRRPATQAGTSTAQQPRSTPTSWARRRA